MGDSALQRCMNAECGATYAIDEVVYACRKRGSWLDVIYDWSRVAVPRSVSFFASQWGPAGRTVEARANFSRVWRFRELLSFAPLDPGGRRLLDPRNSFRSLRDGVTRAVHDRSSRRSASRENIGHNASAAPKIRTRDATVSKVKE